LFRHSIISFTPRF
jgi:translation initiation factor 3 subunit A